MPHYLLQMADTPPWAGLIIKNPHDRVEALTPVLDTMGGTTESAYFTFGEYYLVTILQMPGNVDAAAAGGAVRALTTTPLLSRAEGLDATTTAAASGYTPPEGA